MKDLSQSFLSTEDRERIIATVRTAEQETSGEIVPMIVSSSYDYPMANSIGAAILALPLALVAAVFTGEWLWIGSQNMWLFLFYQILLFIVFHILVKRNLWLKRCFISQREMDEEVEEAATTSFYHQGLHRTRDETGVLIFISVFEQKVWVLADRGINQKVSADQWRDVVRMIVGGIKDNRPAEAISEGIERVGAILKAHFPVKADDVDELANLIVEE